MRKIHFKKWWLFAAAIIALALMSCYVANIRIAGSFRLKAELPVEGLHFSYSALTPFGRSVPVYAGTTYHGNFRKLRFRCSSKMLPLLQQTSFSLETATTTIRFSGSDLKEDKRSLSDGLLLSLPVNAIPQPPLTVRLRSFFSVIFSVAFFLRAILLIALVSLFFYVLFRIRKKHGSLMAAFRHWFHRFLRRLPAILAGFVLAVVVVALLTEITLRIGGAFLRNDAKTDGKKKEKITVLCVGDSFTRGIGASPGMSYPEQLQRLCDSVAPGKAEVISIGEAGQNSSQILDRLQKTLAKSSPDVVVMLFGMANSWNYHGFSPAQSMLYRFRTYRLIKRIAANLRYNTEITEVELQRRKRAEAVYEEAALRLATGHDKADAHRSMGEYHMIMLHFGHAILSFARAATHDSASREALLGLQHAFPRLELELYYSDGDGHSRGKFYLSWLQQMHSRHPANYRYPLLIAAQHLDEGRLREGLQWTEAAIAADTSVFESCNLPLRYLHDSASSVKLLNFFSSLEKKAGIAPRFAAVAKTYLLLRLKRDKEATALLLPALHKWPHSSEVLAALGVSLFENGREMEARELFRKGYQSTKDSAFFHELSACCFMISGDTAAALPHLAASFSARPAGQTALYLAWKSRRLPSYAVRELTQFFTYRSMYEKLTGTEHRFRLEAITGYQYYFFRDILIRYFQPMAGRRTMNLSDAEVFSWIGRDIRRAITAARNSDAAVICMNYPLIPPPNSDEISYWAYHTGLLWKTTARQQQLPFIDNDSIFNLHGQHKQSLFEPRRGGTEHCNDAGYKLMARNILNTLLREAYLKPEIPTEKP
jgi:lysophospholipase L1-like esterase